MLPIEYVLPDPVQGGGHFALVHRRQAEPGDLDRHPPSLAAGTPRARSKAWSASNVPARREVREVGAGVALAASGPATRGSFRGGWALRRHPSGGLLVQSIHCVRSIGACLILGSFGLDPEVPGWAVRSLARAWE